jgi:hypothetical protein
MIELENRKRPAAAKESGDATPPLTAEEKKNLRPVYILTQVFIVSIFYIVLTFMFFGPFYLWETAIYLTLVMSPVLLVVFILARKLCAGVRARGWTPEWAAGGTVFVTASVLLGTLFIVNAAFDKSPSEARHLTIEEKGRNYLTRHAHYFAWFASPVASPLPFAFSKLQNVDVDWSQYDKIRPGVSTIDLTIHKGFLGFPWYESDYRISDAP